MTDWTLAEIVMFYSPLVGFITLMLTWRGLCHRIGAIVRGAKGKSPSTLVHGTSAGHGAPRSH